MIQPMHAEAAVDLARHGLRPFGDLSADDLAQMTADEAHQRSVSRETARTLGSMMHDVDRLEQQRSDLHQELGPLNALIGQLDDFLRSHGIRPGASPRHDVVTPPQPGEVPTMFQPGPVGGLSNA